ncbi:MAG: hypothetical protein K5870_06035 [Lachnospiraceae bacterium]|nr:hypothetical protein [Lachnospiraceae bacterium]
MKKTKLLFEKFYKDNGGMSIVTVIVAIGMVLLMVNILLLTSTVNFKMRNMNVYSKDSFYSAEQVLDEIEVGLQQLVSDGLSQAYMEVLTKYDTSEMTSAEKNEEVKRRFYLYIEDKLGIEDGKKFRYIAMPADPDDPDAKEGLYGLLKPSTRYNKAGLIPEPGKPEADVSYGAFLRTIPTDPLADPDSVFTVIDSKTYCTGEMLESAKDGIRLKNLIVYYKDPNGFVSTIKTDINLVYPEFTFANTDMPDIASYCLVTDTGIFDTKKGNTRSAANTCILSGNSFAYRVNTTGTKFDYKDHPKSDNVHVVYSDYSISNGGITTYDKTRLWAGDIIAKSSDVLLAGKTYVQDDLDLQGRNCLVKMSGYYYGFGNGDSASGSSAILVNGVDTVIDLENVRRISLAGRSYISFEDEADKNEDGSIKKEKIMKDPAHQAAINPNPVGIYMGESVAAKSDQLMYLVPPECIGVAVSTSIGESGETVETYAGSKFTKNPLTTTEYQQILDDPNCVMIASNMNVSKLGSGDTAKLGYYLKNGNEVQKIVVRPSSGGDSLVYFYMQFADEEKANLFFAKYYDLNKDAVDRYMEKYIKTINLPTTGSMLLKVSMAGNTVTDNLPEAEIDPNTGKKKRVISGITTKLDDDDLTISDHYAEDYEEYSTMMLGYATKLSDDYQTLMDNGALSRDKDNKAVFKNLIDETSLDEVVDGTEAYLFDGPKKRALLINMKSETAVRDLSASDVKDCHLIIADCSVTIPDGAEFSGTMIVKGKITLNGNATFTSDNTLVDSCMFLTTEDGTFTVADVFKDSTELTNLSSLDGDVTTDVNIEDLVAFENWTRNVPIK